MMRGAVLTTRIRSDEKLLLEAFERRGIDCDIIDLRKICLPLVQTKLPFDFALNRSIGQTEGLSAIEYYECQGLPTVNSSSVIACCGDKATMTLAFTKANLPIPQTAICYSAASALEAAEGIGYPVVLKPVIGSWGRMIVRLDDPVAATSVFSYKENLPSLHQRIYYLQKYVEKPGRDIRIVVIGGRVVTGYYRYSENWVTNVHLGAVGAIGVFADEVADLAVRAAAAVGGGAVSVDLMEDSDGNVLVNEVNHTMEFVEATRVTGVDIADNYVSLCRDMAR